MRWTIIRLIWGRELRDQLRDRRTMFVMVLLPLLIYPLGGIGLMQIVLGSGQKRSVVGIVGAAHLPADPRPAEPNPFPPLLQRDGDRTAIVDAYFRHPAEKSLLAVQLLDPADRTPLEQGTVDLLLVAPADFRARLEAGDSPPLTILSRPDDRSRTANQRLLG